MGRWVARDKLRVKSGEEINAIKKPQLYKVCIGLRQCATIITGQVKFGETAGKRQLHKRLPKNLTSASAVDLSTFL